MGKFDGLIDGLVDDEEIKENETSKNEEEKKDKGENKEGENEEGKSKEGKEGEEEKKEEDKGEGEKGGEDKKEEEKKDGDEEKKDGDEDDEFDDFFAPEADTKKDDADSGEGTTPSVSFKNLAKKFDVDIEDDNEDTFFEKINDKIQKAKQDVDVSSFTPDAQLIVRHLNENEGSVEDFILNKTILQLHGILNMDTEEKVHMIRVNELVNSGLSNEEAIEKTNKELEAYSTRDLKNVSDSIDQRVQELIDQEIKTITSKRDAEIIAKKQSDEKAILKEKESLKNFILKQDDFLGIKITGKAKQAVIDDLEKGVFDTVTNTDPAQSKFIAYMLRKHGDKIKEKLATMIADENRSGYNAGLKKATDILHKTKDSAKTKTTGHQESKSAGDKKNFETWSDDLFDEGE